MKLDLIYDIQFFIGDFDLSDNIYSVELGTSINNIMHGIIIKAKIDSVDILRNKIFGQKDASLTIKLTTTDKTIYESTKLECIITNIAFIADMKSSNANIEDPPHSQHIQFQCVPKNQFLSMYTTVNKLFKNDLNIKPIDAIQAISDTFISKMQVSIDRSRSNTQPIKQLQVPPMNFCKSIKFVDSKYPLYKNGTPFMFGDLNNNLRIDNLNTSITNAPIYSIFILTKGIGARDKEDIYKTEVRQRNFFTYSGIKTNYSTNNKIITNGYQKKYTVPNKKILMNSMVVDVDEIYDKSTMRSKNTPLFFNESLKERIVIDTNIIGEETTTLITNNYNKLFSSNSTISITLDGNLPIEHLSKVGIPIEIKTQIPSYQDYAGKYIVTLSDIQFKKNNRSYFSIFVTISCARSNY